IEHSTSAVNWQARNRAKSVGELARNSLSHIARGADGALFFQWRQSTAGSEQFHSSVVPHAGADSKIFREVTALGATLKNIREVLGSRVEKSQVAILFDFDAAMALRSGPKPSADVNALDVALTLHRELTARGIQVDVIHPSAPLDGYKAVLAPTLFLLTADNAARLGDYVAGGGHLLVTSFSGIVSETNRVVAGGYPGYLRDVLGVRVEEFFPLFADETVTLSDGSVGQIWSETIFAAEGTKVLATYATGELAGMPAVTLNTVGAGTAQYVSTQLDRVATGSLVEALVDRAGIIPVAVAAAGLELVRRVSSDAVPARWLFAINHTDQPLTLQATGLDLVAGARFAPGDTVAPGAVSVIREDPTA
ncbi:MAG: Beta-galactosidase, partial [Glaciihabitans sp.]|nr:Beta-galactosidase [Glaciihabitans sp.]